MPGEVDPSRGGHVEVVGDGVLAHAVDLLDAEGVGAGDGELFEVDRRPLPPTRCGDAALDEGAALGEHAHADLQGLGPGDGVVDDVDPARVGDGQPVEGRVEHAAGPRGQLLDEREARFVGEHLGWRRAGWRTRPGRRSAPPRATSTSGNSARNAATLVTPSAPAP